MSCSLNFSLTDAEAESLWSFLNRRQDQLDVDTDRILKRLESVLWDRMTIDQMAMVGKTGGGHE